jgi:hypothetical protein
VEPSRIPNGLTNGDDVKRLKCVIDVIRNFAAARPRIYNWFVALL